MLLLLFYYYYWLLFERSDLFYILICKWDEGNGRDYRSVDQRGLCYHQTIICVVVVNPLIERFGLWLDCFSSISTVEYTIIIEPVIFI